MRPFGAASVALLLASCGTSTGPAAEPSVPTFTVTSPDFADTIPVGLTCDGSNRMPSLQWSGEPAATKQFGVIVFDPDAPGGDFTHWSVYGIPPTTHTIGSGVPVGVSEGLNDFGKAGWSGPCPPHGQKHRYAFLVRALNTADAPPAVSRRAAVESAEESHIIGRAEMVATYTRP